MQWISFGWTCPALLAGRKTVTRRDWKDSHAARFHKGDLVAAYDRSPRNGGHQVATLRLIADPHKESSALAPVQDYEREGFAYLEEHGFKVMGHRPKVLWRLWHLRPIDLWVVRFEVLAE